MTVRNRIILVAFVAQLALILASNFLCMPCAGSLLHLL